MVPNRPPGECQKMGMPRVALKFWVSKTCPHRWCHSGGFRATRRGGVTNRWCQAGFRGHGTGTIYLSPTVYIYIYIYIYVSNEKNSLTFRLPKRPLTHKLTQALTHTYASRAAHPTHCRQYSSNRTLHRTPPGGEPTGRLRRAYAELTQSLRTIRTNLAFG